MKNETQQPFTDSTPRSTDDRKLVAEVLGTEEAAEMEELLGQKQNPEESRMTDVSLGISDEEAEAVVEGEKSLEETRRNEYIAWAVSISLNEDWVDETFVFSSDGTVSVVGNISLPLLEIKVLPSNFIEISGSLNLDTNNITSLEELPRTIGESLVLSYNKITSLKGLPHDVGESYFLNNNQITSLKGLPDTVNKHLALAGNQITSLEGLPSFVGTDLSLSDNPITSLEGLSACTIGRDLSLKNIPATSIPEGLDIKGSIYLLASQKDLKADCEAKGYRVVIM